MNIAEYQEKINKKYPKEDLTLLEYTKAKEPGKIKCNTCGKIYSYTLIENSCKKSKKVLCQECGTREKKLNSFKNSLKQRFPHDSLEVLDFTTRQRPCKIKCLICGEVVTFQTAVSALKRSKYFCKKCHPYKTDIRQKKIEELENFFNQSKQWTLVSDLSEISHHLTKIEAKCKICGNKSTKNIYDYLRGKGCLYCCGKKLKTTEEFQQELDKDYTLLSDYKNANTKVLLRHSCGFIYSTTPHNYLNGRRCPKCMRKHSKGENKIKSILEKYSIDFIQEFPVRISNHLLRFDFYLSDYDRYIEYQGEQHYAPVSYFGGQESFQRQQEYDQLKRSLVSEKLIEISYKDYDDIEAILQKALKFNDYPEKEYTISD